MRRRVDRWNFRRVCGVACAVVAVVCVARALGVRTFSHATDYACVLAAVVAYIVATAFAWRIWPQAAGVAAGLLATPLLALAALGGWSAVGVFQAIGFLVPVIAAPPHYTEEISPTLSCRVYVEGAFTDSHDTVYVYRHPPFFPFVQLEVAGVPVDAMGPGDAQRSASCASVAARLRS